MNKVEGKMFTDPLFDGDYEIYEITEDDLQVGVEYDQDVVYLYNDYIYNFIGPINSIPKAPKGSIARFRDRIVVIEHTDLNRPYYHKDKIYDPSLREQVTIDFDDIFDKYSDKYDMGMNVMSSNKSLLLNSGDIFVPELCSDDDPLTMAVKTLILSMEVNLNAHRATHPKELPTLDNLRSGLINPNRELSIPYFLGWESVLNLDWEFSIIDKVGTASPMCGRRVITNYTDLEDVESTNLEIEELLSAGANKISLVLLTPNEDPLKRLVKLALFDKRINIKDYKDKGSTPNLVNNMMSTLKGKSKMSMSYFINWCEVLGLIAEFRMVTKDGKFSTTSGVF